MIKAMKTLLAISALIIVSSNAYSEAYEPERNKILDVTPYELIDLPGTDMKAGSFSIDFIDKEGRNETTGKVGILKKDGTLLYVQAGKELRAWTDAFGCNYGLYKQYLTVDCFAFGASHNRRMFLFKYGKDTVELLDVINEPYFNRYSSFDFQSLSYAELKIKTKRIGSKRTYIEDIDNNGNPELVIEFFPHLRARMYLEIKDDKLWPDLRPEFYKPLFEKVRNKKKKYAYYYYGYLSGTYSKAEIEAMTKSNQTHDYIISMTADTNAWYEAFHRGIDFKEITLKTHQIKRSK